MRQSRQISWGAGVGRILFVGAFLALVSVSAREPVPLARVDLDVGAMAHTVPQVYGMGMRAVSPDGQGAITMKAKVVLVTEVTEREIVFRDRYDIMGREFRMTSHCEKTPVLDLKSASMKIRKGDEPAMTASLIVADGEAKVIAGEHEATVPFPPGTVVQGALFRIVPRLPRTAGASYTFGSYSDSLEIRARFPPEGKLFRIDCKGTETIDAGGRDATCTRYDVLHGRTTRFFVDVDGQIARVEADNGQTILIPEPRE